MRLPRHWRMVPKQCITFPNFSWDTLLGKGTSPFLLAPEPVGTSAYSTCNVSCWSISVPTGPGKRQEEITCHPSLRNILIPASTTCYLTLGATYWTMMMITLISSFCRFVVSTGKLLLQKVGLTGILERLHPRPRLHRCAWAWMKHSWKTFSFKTPLTFFQVDVVSGLPCIFGFFGLPHNFLCLGASGDKHQTIVSCNCLISAYEELQWANKIAAMMQAPSVCRLDCEQVLCPRPDRTEP